MQGFLKNLYLRPSCHACPARSGTSGSDITIADYWGIARWLPDFDDDKGVGLVMIHTPQGVAAYGALDMESIETTYEQALAGNPCITRSVAVPKYRNRFWREYAEQDIAAIATICRRMQPSFPSRCFSLAKLIVKRIVGRI